MTLNEYQERAMSTCMESSNNYSYMSEGLDGEVGEFKSKVAKAIRKGYITIDGNQLTMETENINDGIYSDLLLGLAKELGDILWFVAGLAKVMGCELEDIAEMNLDKLQARKANGTIEGNGDGVTKEERR